MKNSRSVLRRLWSVLANLTVILSANYIVFYILDHYNPGLHFVLHSTFFPTEHLHLAIAGLMLLTGVLYAALQRAGAWEGYRFERKRLLRIVLLDVLLAGAFAMIVNTYAFDWLHIREIKQENIVAVATPTPKPEEERVTLSPKPTEPPDAAAETPENASPSAAPKDTPEPTATPIPGLLGNKYAEKFGDGAPVVTEPNTQETLQDGTVRTLLYTYAGRQAAVELYHYQKGKLEYQIADVYVRDIRYLPANFVLNQSNAKRLPEYGRMMSALIAINTDNFIDNATNEGLIIRNGYLLQSKPCINADLCVVYQDGSMRCFEHETEPIDNEAIIASYPYHTFYFGPSLLNADGSAREKIPSPVGTYNPRTALGYYEPGHYAFISVLGTRNRKDIDGKSLGKSDSPGMKLTELSTLCAELGLQSAYNLDGGQSIGMYWNGRLFGHNNRGMGDALAVIDEGGITP